LDASSFETLNRKVKGSEETYLHKLQDWLVGYLIIGQYEQSSYWSKLDFNYLETGNWVIGDLVRGLYQDPKLLSRLMIAHSIVTITENYEAVQDKIFEIVDAMDDFGDEVIQLEEPDSNLFDPGNPKFALITSSLEVEYLTPKQVIVFGRYVDQRLAIQDEFIDLNLELANCEDPMGIYNYSIAVSKLAHRSSYDQGNINYNVDRVYGTQFAIVNTLERLTEDYTILTGFSGEQLRSLWQDLPYDTIAEEWEGYLPVLQVD
jgi:hypothetical protein